MVYTYLSDYISYIKETEEESYPLGDIFCSSSSFLVSWKGTEIDLQLPVEPKN